MTTHTATVFQSGNSQAIRLPKALQFQSKRVTLEKNGDQLIVREKVETMAELIAQLPRLNDFPLQPDNAPEVEKHLTPW